MKMSRFLFFSVVSLHMNWPRVVSLSRLKYKFKLQIYRRPERVEHCRSYRAVVRFNSQNSLQLSHVNFIWITNSSCYTRPPTMKMPMQITLTVNKSDNTKKKRSYHDWLSAEYRINCAREKVPWKPYENERCLCAAAWNSMQSNVNNTAHWVRLIVRQFVEIEIMEPKNTNPLFSHCSHNASRQFKSSSSICCQFNSLWWQRDNIFMHLKTFFGFSTAFSVLHFHFE